MIKTWVLSLFVILGLVATSVFGALPEHDENCVRRMFESGTQRTGQKLSRRAMVGAIASVFVGTPLYIYQRIDKLYDRFVVAYSTDENFALVDLHTWTNAGLRVMRFLHPLDGGVQAIEHLNTALKVNKLPEVKADAKIEGFFTGRQGTALELIDWIGMLNSKTDPRAAFKTLYFFFTSMSTFTGIENRMALLEKTIANEVKVRERKPQGIHLDGIFGILKVVNRALRNGENDALAEIDLLGGRDKLDIGPLTIAGAYHYLLEAWLETYGPTLTEWEAGAVPKALLGSQLVMRGKADASTYEGLENIVNDEIRAAVRRVVGAAKAKRDGVPTLIQVPKSLENLIRDEVKAIVPAVIEIKPEEVKKK